MKNNFRPIIATSIITICLLASCASNKYTNKTKHEEVIAVIHEDVNGIIHNDEIVPQVDPSMAEGSRGLLIEAISMATNGIKALIDMDKKKYTAGYSSSKQQLYFYNYISDKGAIDPTGIQFEGIEIIRLAQTSKDVIDTTLYLKLSVDTQNPQEIINNSIFKMKVDSLRLKYAKAKVPGFRWYLPWTVLYINQPKINLDIELNFTASWMFRDGSAMRNSPIGTFALNLREIPLDSRSKEYQSFYNNLKNRPLDGYSFLVPRSFGRYINEQGESKECFGQGSYNILVKVSEAGKEHFVSKLVMDNSNTIIDRVNQKVVNKVYGF